MVQIHASYVLKVYVPGGRPKARYVDVVREDRKLAGASKEDAGDRGKLRGMILPWQPPKGEAVKKI